MSALYCSDGMGGDFICHSCLILQLHPLATHEAGCTKASSSVGWRLYSVS